MKSQSSEKVKRVSSGVEGLDKLIYGGYQRGKTVTITGGPGVGKTIMALQFIHKMCEEGLKCVLIASEETPDELREQSDLLGLPLDQFEEDGSLTIVPALAERMKEVEWRRGKPSKPFIFKKPLEILENTQADAVVIDNIGVYTVDISIGMFRDQMDYLVNFLREKDTTSLIICDETIDERYNKVALYSVHGAIHLFKRENPFTGNVERLMNVVKMRGTKTPLEYVKYHIDGDGIKIEKTD